MPSIINAVLAISALYAIYRHLKHFPSLKLFRYFTVLSNLFCAFIALTIVIFRMLGVFPLAVSVLKYIATVEVTVTLLTVLFFLGPTLGYKLMFTGPDLWLHLLCPLLALISFFAYDRKSMPFITVLLGVLPVALYGCLYLWKVVFTSGEKAWEDFYGFNRGGKWAVSFIAMLAATFLLSLVLWVI